MKDFIKVNSLTLIKKFVFVLVLFFSMVIIFFLLRFFLSSHQIEKTSDVKYNMHGLQTIIETYYYDYKTYPSSIESLKKDAKKKGYWREYKNPYTKQNIKFIQIYNIPKEIHTSINVERGTIACYIDQKNSNSYRIFGLVEDNNLLTNRDGSIFYLQDQK